MPKQSSNLLELARRGAAIRLAELKAEVAALVKAFPYLESGSRKRSKGQRERIDASLEWGAAAVMDAKPPRKRKRPKWSAAARKAAALRMKRYWAARRGKRKK